MLLSDSTRYALDTYENQSLSPTGMSHVDRLVTGIGPGTLAVVGALYGVGKSSLALGACVALALRGIPVGLVSLEDPSDLVGARALGFLANVNPLKIRNGSLSPMEASQVAAAASTATTLPLHLEFAIGGRVGPSTRAVEKLADAGCRLVWVDYAQAVAGGCGEPSAVASALGALLETADRVGVALVLLSQLTERRNQRGEALPATLGSLRGTGDLAIRARLAVLAEPISPTVVRATLAKNTFGPAGAQWYLDRGADGALRERTTEVLADPVTEEW